jgi:ZIP family zinc transporter
MAVGLAASIAQYGETVVITTASAAALSIGIGLQNLPEGAAVALPLRREGVSRGKAFSLGVLSAVVEPIGAVVAVLLSGEDCRDYALDAGFCRRGDAFRGRDVLIRKITLETLQHWDDRVLSGFLVMLVLDVALVKI